MSTSYTYVVNDTKKYVFNFLVDGTAPTLASAIFYFQSPWGVVTSHIGSITGLGQATWIDIPSTIVWEGTWIIWCSITIAGGISLNSTPVVITVQSDKRVM